jgi:DNA-binding GntR family transcriptional regulator
MESGELKPGARVSIGYESQARNVARQTVAHALRLLEAEGWLKRFPGHGYVFVD